VETVCSSETLVYNQKNTQCKNQEDHDLNCRLTKKHKYGAQVLKRITGVNNINFTHPAESVVAVRDAPDTSSGEDRVVG
jgi:hypothetical protein